MSIKDEAEPQKKKDLKDVIACNLIELRQQAGITQLQLAEMLNYSDKAVSKWERGESIPDLRVLIKIAEIYHISLDDLVREKPDKPVKPKLNIFKKHVLITLLSVGLVWVIATAVFMIFYYIMPLARYSYLAFLFAPFISSVVYTVFASVWFRRITLAFSASFVLWSIILIIHVMLRLFTSITIWPFYLVAGLIQVLVIGWFILRKLYKPNRHKEK